MSPGDLLLFFFLLLPLVNGKWMSLARFFRNLNRQRDIGGSSEEGIDDGGEGK